jgi:hypothetical protein
MQRLCNRWFLAVVHSPYYSAIDYGCSQRSGVMLHRSGSLYSATAALKQGE